MWFRRRQNGAAGAAQRVAGIVRHRAEPGFVAALTAADAEFRRPGFETELADHLRSHPDLVADWTAWSADQRSSPSAYVEGTEAGWFDNGRRYVRLHADAAGAVADLVRRLAAWHARREVLDPDTDPGGAVIIRRAWHWGIAVLCDPSLGGAVPEVDPHRPVSANDSGVIVLVRHAQDVDGDGPEPAEATLTVRRGGPDPAVAPGTTVLFEGRIATPNGRLSIGDADAEQLLTVLGPTTALRVAVPVDEPDSPRRVRVDVWDA